jgi:hypothetical protein
MPAPVIQLADARRLRKRNRPIVRPALDTDSQVVQWLVSQTGMYPYLDELDWSNIHPFWLLAIHNGKPVGTVQMLHGLPVGRVEFLSIDKRLNKTLRAKVAHALVHTSLGFLRQMGCQAEANVAVDPDWDWMNILHRRGGVAVAQGFLVIKRLR